MDGIKFEPYEMTNKEAEETLQGIAGLLYMLVAGGAFKEFDDNNPILHMVNKYPYAASKAVEAMRCMDNKLDIEKEDDK